MIQVEVVGGVMSEEEQQAYVRHAEERYAHQRLPERMIIHMDGDFVDLEYRFAPVPFDRIRRITGYLVGTTARFNNAKRAEERDRVKHGI